MSDQREMTLDEYLESKLPEFHLARRQLQELRAERDALAAHVERVKDWWGDERRIRVDMREIEAIVASSPETSLARLKAEWQAEVLIEFGYLFGPESTVRMMTQREADKLRRQAEGGEP